MNICVNNSLFQTSRGIECTEVERWRLLPGINILCAQTFVRNVFTPFIELSDNVVRRCVRKFGRFALFAFRIVVFSLLLKLCLPLLKNGTRWSLIPQMVSIVRLVRSLQWNPEVRTQPDEDKERDA